MHIYIQRIMEDEHENRVECVTIVLLEMSLSLFGIIFNLLIITTLRQDGSLPASMLNCLLLNLCFSNLIISFFVKPISAIYIGYSIFTNQWRINLVFCTLYTLAYQTTWCTFPLTILVLSWLKILSLLRATCQCYRGPSWLTTTEKGTPEITKKPEEPLFNSYSAVRSFDEDEARFLRHHRRSKVKRTVDDGLSLRQKILVIIMWMVSLFFGVMIAYPEKILGRQLISQIRSAQSPPMEVKTELGLLNVSLAGGEEEAEDPSLSSICVIRNGVNDLIDYISISITLMLPMVLGPCCILVFQGFLYFCHRFLCLIDKTQASSQSKKSHPSWGLLLSFLIIFLSTYPLHLYFSEVYLEDPFLFVVFKYFLGSFFILLIPLAILYWEKDIRSGLGSVVGGTIVCQDTKKKKDLHRRSTPCILGGISPSKHPLPRSNKSV